MTAVTVFRGARSPAPIARDEPSWDDLVTEVSALCAEETDVTDKLGLVAIGPYRLRDGATRSAAAVETMADVCMLDVDAGLDLEALRGRIAELGLDAVVHGTPSDDEHGERKARVFVRLDREHAPSECASVRASVAALLGVRDDPSTRNADRIGFCGRLAGTPPRYFERFAGAPLSLDTLPRVDVTTPLPRATTAPTEATHDPARTAAQYAILGALGDVARYDGRKHALVGALGGVLRKAGWTRSACADVVRAWLSSHSDAGRGVDVDAGVRWACAAWDRLPEEVSGRATLDAHAGVDVGAVVEQAAILPFRVRRVDAAVTDDAASESPSEYVTFRLVDRSRPPPELQYVCEGLDLAAGKVSAIQGFAYTSKTPFGLLLSLCVASGLDFLGLAVVQSPVLYLDHEGGGLTEEREARICAGLGLTRTDVPLHLAHADALSDAMLDEIERYTASHGVRFVVVDTYSSAIPIDGTTFNDSSFRAWANRLGAFSNATGVCVAIMLHENKGAKGEDGIRGISGHGALAGALQASIVLTRPDESKPHTIRVSCGRAARKGFERFSVTWSDVDDPDAPTGQALVAVRGTEAATTAPRAEAAAKGVASGEQRAAVLSAGTAIMRSIPRASWTSRGELLALGGGSRNAGLEALKRLVDAGILQYRAGQYGLTPGSESVTTIAIASALGATAGFTR